MSSSKVESFVDEHEAFAASRVSQYVFVPTKDIYFNTLDQHADTLEGDVKPPLVLVGNEGSGKSALLANWVSKRREHKHRDEFLFQHFVGCTTQSLELAHTLFRLETALKDFFQLREMKVPDTEVELRWSLNRFLEAASKKHFPARIVIIIDGIHRLKAEGTPDGTLYWLPTELPPCVRFIVSTVEFERNPRGKRENPQHLTYVELCRRQCPILKIEPLGVATRHSVINAFCSLHPEDVDISEAQQFKIVTAQSSAQPMYLRTLLQALRLATTLTKVNSDELLDQFLACNTAHELIDRNLNVCCQSEDTFDGNFDENLFGLTGNADNVLPDLLGKMMTVVYVSRSGLTEAEIWGLIKMVTQTEPTEEQTRKLMCILKDYTMVVNDMYSFSHEIYREVVFAKYITSRSSLIKWHNILARFFGQLPPCDRKLVALPYHLEKAGSWSKVKNCLTDIEMFQLWWTSKFKNDFIKFWASLTQRISIVGDDIKDENVKINSSNATNISNGPNTTLIGNSSSNSLEADSTVLRNRPSYDVVDEYVKSLDEYRTLKHPSDETVAGIILEIGDFLLEFATLGHEKDADVPALIHPKVLSEDLKAIGVPYIEIDEDGRSSLVYPEILHSLCNKQKNDIDGSTADAPTKAIEDVPVCTNYFYHRWMWIQYPYVALGNCDVRYTEGVNQKLQDMTATEAGVNNNGNKSSKNILSNSMNTLRHSTSADSIRLKKNNLLSASMNSMPGNPNDSGAPMKTWDPKTFKLPEIKFNRKAARSVPRILREDHLNENGSGGNNKVAQRMVALQDSIQNYREEYDFLIQMKTILIRRLQDFKDNLKDLQRTAEGCTQFDDDLHLAIKREEDASVKCENVKLYNKNLYELSLMCDRYPANVPALITELTNKIELDKLIIAEIKKRLWEQKFERQRYQITFHHMKSLIKEAVDMHNKLLEYRYTLRKDLTQQAIEDEKVLTQKNSALSKSSNNFSTNSGSKLDMSNKKSDATAKQLKTGKGSTKLGPVSGENASVGSVETEIHIPQQLTWEEKWSLISSRTGIIEPDAFFQRMNNASTLEKQIHVIKKTSESRLELLKKEVVQVESELEEVRYEASFAGVQSSKEHQKQLAEKQQKLRHIKEKTESMEQLEQKIVSGLAHISDILFIPKSEEDAPVLNLVRDIEAVLDTLINEREKQLQQQQGGNNNNSSALLPTLMNESSHNSNSANTNNRSPELDFAIAKHESPKVRLPKRLPSRPVVEKEESYERIESIDEDEQEDDGTWNRSYVKTVSLKNLKSEVKKRNQNNNNPQDPNLTGNNKLSKTSN